ncbi:uncharacterized protein EDB93DRAFT_1109684 [Suillus bovinus]|uniref:uncharacterized protein n=1 Tax=Suillus bovinus TaxID=48563 RepID=UPI001B886F6C|nr:uncharacterized protein EDB93DRAFT_1109684 [Suillus bovinus]KAG2126350.1 hypothetical protein EDB93DRAFT_1109684 [Suillus bovinus]
MPPKAIERPKRTIYLKKSLTSLSDISSTNTSTESSLLDTPELRINKIEEHILDQENSEYEFQRKPNRIVASPAHDTNQTITKDKEDARNNTPGWFHGKANENVQNFLREVDRYIMLNKLKTEQGKITVFSTLLLSGSISDTWWNKLDNTTAGQAAYDNQLKQWLATNGQTRRVTENTQFPLRPGNAMICSGECFKCSAHGHMSVDCRVPEASQLPFQEKIWRSLAARALGNFNRMNATQINVVFEEEYVQWDQGKGSGSDLYSTAEEKDNKQWYLPFLQYTSFLGPQGKVVRVKALFNEGAMMSIMCSSVFNNVKHRLWNWTPSTKRLCMVNGAIVQLEAMWKGEVVIGGSGGGWKFLFGKPLLQAFKAVHNYEVDEVQVTGTRTLYNQMQVIKASITEVENDEETQSNEPDNLLKEVPTDFLANDKAIFMRLTNPHNPLLQYGQDLTLEELEQVKALVTEYADIFTCSLGEVLLVPGAVHLLNIPDGTTFNLRVHQWPLTPPQTQFLHGKIDKMLEVDIIEYTPPKAVKCCANMILAKKVYEQEGMILEELQYTVNEQCSQNGQPPAFMLPECEVPEEPARESSTLKPQKWRICQNFNEVN